MQNTTSRIMKAEQARELAAKANFNFEDIRGRCDDYIQKTREKVEALLIQAHEDGKVIHQKAFDEGRKEGKVQGLVDAETEIKNKATEIAEQRIKEELNKLTPALASAVEQIRQEQQQCLVHWNSEAIHLAIGIAEKILRQKVENDPAIIIDRVSELIRLTVGDTNICIHLHPDDAKVINDAGILLENTSSNDSHQTTRVLPNPDLLPGDCKVESKHGTLDASIDEQLKRIASELCY